MSSLKTSKHVSEQFVQWCELSEHLLIILRQKEENLTLALTINHQESQEEHIEWYQRIQICALIDDEQHFLAEQALNRERSRRTYYAKLTQAGLVRCQKNIERIENKLNSQKLLVKQLEDRVSAWVPTSADTLVVNTPFRLDIIQEEDG